MIRICRSGACSRKIPLLMAAALFLVAFRSGAHAGAIDQLCGAAGYGAGCVSASVPRVSMPKPVGGSMRSTVPRSALSPKLNGMGGLFTSILTNLVVDALVSEATGAEAGSEGGEVSQARVDAFRKAVEDQKRIQEERDLKFQESLLDTSASRLLDDTGDLKLLEEMRADAGRAFDGTGTPDGNWMAVHDPWFSTGAPGSQSLPVSDKPLDYAEGDLKPVECTSSLGGTLCGFSPSAKPVITVNPMTVRPPSVMNSTPTPGSPVPRLVVQSGESGGSMVGAAQRTWADLVETVHGPEFPATVISTVVVPMGEIALPEIQLRIAAEGRNVYQNVMEKLVGNTLEVLTDAAAGRWEDAIEKSDPGRLLHDTGEDLVRSSTYGKLLWPMLTGRPLGTVREAGDLATEYATDKAKETATDWALDKAKIAGKKAMHWFVRPASPFS